MINLFIKGQSNGSEDIELKRMRTVRDFCIDFCIAFAVVMLILQFVQPNRVYQESMRPTYNERDMILVNKIAYHGSEPEPGDIIVFDSGDAERERYIKRVVAVAGDHVEIHDGRVIVNNVIQNQSFTSEDYTDGNINLVVPEDSCFVLGDNRSVSIDSRSDDIGCVSYDKIIGKVMFTKHVELYEEAE